MSDYHLAFVEGGTGNFDIVETFTAENDKAARETAESIASENYPEFGPWYVLNSDRNNIDA